MTDPVTIGAIAASALAMAAEAMLKGAVGEAVKDAYKTLKEKLTAWAGSDVEALAKEPDSKGRQLTIAEKVDKQSPDDQSAVRALAETLIARLKQSAPAIGLEMGQLTDLETQLGNIKVTHGVGVRVYEAHGGSFKTGDITVGDQSGN